MAKALDGIFSPFLAECFALRKGLMFVKELESALLDMETDAINIVSAVLEDRDLAEESPILDDARQLLIQLKSIGVNHIRRGANQVAHLLAMFGFNSNRTKV